MVQLFSKHGSTCNKPFYNLNQEHFIKVPRLKVKYLVNKRNFSTSSKKYSLIDLLVIVNNSKTREEQFF